MLIANTYCHRMTIVTLLILGLIFAPMTPSVVSAAEQGAGAAGSTSENPATGAAGGTAAGVDVSGSSDKKKPKGKGALAPPPAPTKPAESKPTPAPEPVPVKTAEEKAAEKKVAEEKKKPKAIGASAGKAGPATTEPSGGMSMGWKITAGVLGVGLLLGLAGGGGGGGGGGGTPPAHNP